MTLGELVRVAGRLGLLERLVLLNNTTSNIPRFKIHDRTS